MDLAKLEALQDKQPILNVGTLGHVANGKTSLVKQLSGVVTQKSRKELEEQRTMKLGYANVKIYLCPSCPPPQSYQSTGSETKELCCKFCGTLTTLVRHLSIVDCPGHHTFMEIMLGGTSVMDTSILVEAAPNRTVPAPQTLEHLLAAEISGQLPAFVCFNKMDLLSKKSFIQKMEEFKSTLKAKEMSVPPIVPTCATFGENMDVVCEYLAKIPIPSRPLTPPFSMLVIRSFNVNRQNVNIADLKGAVLGGSIRSGIFKVGDRLELRPGVCGKKEGKLSYFPLRTSVLSIFSEKTSLEEAVPGGLLGVQTTLDPALASKNRLVGNQAFVLTEGEKLPRVYSTFWVEYKIFPAELIAGPPFKLRPGDLVTVNCHAVQLEAKIGELTKPKKKKRRRMLLELTTLPLCLRENEFLALSKDLGEAGSRLIGMARFIEGQEALLAPPSSPFS